MSEKESLWVSSHIFYDPKQIDSLLLKGIYPFMKNLRENRFFFIRYRENGSHIRLRIKARNFEEKTILKRTQTAHFKIFFLKFPSQREEPKAVKEGVHYWYPNNSIHYIEYTREMDRYGGSLGITVSEEHFQFSSQVVLELLRQESNLTYQKKLTLALILNLSFVIGCGLSKNAAIHFFNFLFITWLPLSYRTKGSIQLDDESYEKLKKQTFSIFNAKFEEQKNKIAPKIKKWWCSFNNSKQSSDFLQENWIKKTAFVKKKFSDGLFKKEIEIPVSFQSQLVKHLDKKEIKNFNTDLWFIFQSLAHMTNNRLGLRTRDEPYIYYLLFRSLMSFS